MPNNLGIYNEDELVAAINNKKVFELSRNLKFIFCRIYGPLDEEEILHAERLNNFMKPDFWVEYKGNRKYISLKSGRATEVHQEKLETFVPFLRENGLSEESIKFFKEYCYADGTEDGTGKEAYDFPRLKLHYEKRIAKFNKELIDNPTLINKILYRCVFEGAIPNAIPADYIYFGNSEYGEIMSFKQLQKHMSYRTYSFMTNPHIGPLQFRAKIRGQARDPSKEYLRHCVQIWWANLEAEIHYIASRFSL